MACPFGFGSGGSGGSPLSEYHCMLCRGLMHHPVQLTPCTHKFCRFCISPAADCPACGVDIQGTTPCPELQATIDTLLMGHAKLGQKSPAQQATPRNSGTGEGGEVADPAVVDNLSSLLLQLALQSLAGGNAEAAYERLELCKQQICIALAPGPAAGAAAAADEAGRGVTAAHAAAPPDPAHGAATGPHGADAASAAASNRDTAAGSKADATHAAHGGASSSDVEAAAAGVVSFAACARAAKTSPEAATKLGTVLGCQADCCARVGQAEAAGRLYQASIACLESCKGHNDDVDQSLTVSYNKLGGLLQGTGDLEGALQQYHKALDMRRQALAAAESASASPPVATSHSSEGRAPAAEGAATSGAGSDAAGPSGGSSSAQPAAGGPSSDGRSSSSGGGAEAQGGGGAPGAAAARTAQLLLDLASSLVMVSDILFSQPQPGAQARAHVDEARQVLQRISSVCSRGGAPAAAAGGASGGGQAGGSDAVATAVAAATLSPALAAKVFRIELALEQLEKRVSELTA